MSVLFAVVLTLCHGSQGDTVDDMCESYVIAQDTDWHTKRSCFNGGLRPLSNEFAAVWPNDVKLKQWLVQYDVTEAVEDITDYDFTCERQDSK